MKTILVPVDFSAATRTVVAHAILVAHALPARVVLLNVIQPPVVIAEYGALVENVAQLTEAGEKASARQLARLALRFKRRGIAVSVMRKTGSPVPYIVEVAERVRAAYIVMGSHGHTAFFDLLVGSNTHGVLRRSKCPVLVVPPVQPRAKRVKKLL